MYLEKEHLDIVEKLTAEIKDNNMENVTSSLYNDPLFSFLLGDKLEDHYNDIQCLEHEEYERGKHESDLSDQEDYENGEREYHQSLADENDAMDREDHESQNEPEFGHSVEKYLKARIGDDTYELSITDVEDEEGSVYKEHWKMNGELHRYGGGAAKIEKSMHYIPVEKHMDKGENIYCVKGKEIKRESNLTSDEQHESNVHSMLGFGVSRKELEDNYGM
jgi:replicative superfamily II helicase